MFTFGSFLRRPCSFALRWYSVISRHLCCAVFHVSCRAYLSDAKHTTRAGPSKAEQSSRYRQCIASSRPIESSRRFPLAEVGNLAANPGLGFTVRVDSTPNLGACVGARGTSAFSALRSGLSARSMLPMRPRHVVTVPCESFSVSG
jgi:hypothetical protein